jgi:hypothetical protein
VRANRDSDWSDATGGAASERLAAALLFPLGRRDVNDIRDLVLRRGEEQPTAVA